YAARFHRDAVRRALPAVAIASPAGVPAALGRALRLGAPARSGGRAGHLDPCGVGWRDTGGAPTDQRAGYAVSGPSIPADPYDADGPSRWIRDRRTLARTRAAGLPAVRHAVCRAAVPARPRSGHRARHGNRNLAEP